MEKLEMDVFSAAMETCIEYPVDFILISGDLFDSSVPHNLKVVQNAAAKMREVVEHGIPIYCIYGSHEYSATSTSIIEVLESAGLLQKIVQPVMIDNKLKLIPFVDQRTGAKLVGISARKMGLERESYAILDRESLELLEGFKVFAFHSGLDEFKPDYLTQMSTLPLSLLPKGFDYYAGGHIHQKSMHQELGYERIVFPGPLFTGHGRDIEKTASKEPRGFFIVSFDNQVRSTEFVQIEMGDYAFCKLDVTGLNAVQAQLKLEDELLHLDVAGKIVVVRIFGELSGGKISETDLPNLRKILKANGAIHVDISQTGLSSKEYANVKVSGLEASEIEERLFREHIGLIKVSRPQLKNDVGIALSVALLRSLKREKKDTENQDDYDKGIAEDAFETLSLKEVFED